MFAKVGFLGRQRAVGAPDADGLGPDRQAVVRIAAGDWPRPYCRALLRATPAHSAVGVESFVPH